METYAWKTLTSHTYPSAESVPSLVTLLEQLHYPQGEKRLMLAVLIDAVSCIERYRTGRRPQSWSAFRTALTWVLQHEHTWLFSFENICLTLDLNPLRLRSALCAPLVPLLTATRADTFHRKALAGHRPVRG